LQKKTKYLKIPIKINSEKNGHTNKSCNHQNIFNTNSNSTRIKLIALLKEELSKDKHKRVNRAVRDIFSLEQWATEMTKIQETGTIERRRYDLAMSLVYEDSFLSFFIIKSAEAQITQRKNIS